MVIRNLILIALVLFAGSCCGEKELHELSMSKTPYTGNELRIDGYYFSNQTAPKDINIAVFYEDGVCIHLFAEMTSQDTFSFIENKILLDEPFLSRLWNTPTDVGVFKIEGESIEIESWMAAYDITTLSFYGEILNDTTFIISKWTDNEQGESHSVEWTYRFRQFSPKPDSTNNYIK